MHFASFGTSGFEHINQEQKVRVVSVMEKFPKAFMEYVKKLLF